MQYSIVGTVISWKLVVVGNNIAASTCHRGKKTRLNLPIQTTVVRRKFCEGSQFFPEVCGGFFNKVFIKNNVDNFSNWRTGMISTTVRSVAS